MGITKREYSAVDSKPMVLYGKVDSNDTVTYPIIISENGGLLTTQGITVPLHDQKIIDESASPNVTITYKLNGSIVGTKTIVVSVSTTTITVT